MFIYNDLLQIKTGLEVYVDILKYNITSIFSIYNLYNISNIDVNKTIKEYEKLFDNNM